MPVFFVSLKNLGLKEGYFEKFSLTLIYSEGHIKYRLITLLLQAKFKTEVTVM